MAEFKLLEPSSLVQIQLPDGRLIEGPRGSTLGEFLSVLRVAVPFVVQLMTTNGQKNLHSIQQSLFI